MTDPIHTRALELQAEGPDEFPYDYFRHLAEEEIGLTAATERNYGSPMTNDNTQDQTMSPEERLLNAIFGGQSEEQRRLQADRALHAEAEKVRQEGQHSEDYVSRFLDIGHMTINVGDPGIVAALVLDGLMQVVTNEQWEQAVALQAENLQAALEALNP